MEYSKRFEASFPQLLKDEGGWKFTDDKNDPGGMTYGGMTLGTLNSYEKLYNKTGYEEYNFKIMAEGDNPILQSDVTDCYWERFWIAGHSSEMAPSLDALMFSINVNLGTRNGLKVLQDALSVTEDGVWGPQTEMAMDEAQASYVNFEMMVINSWENKYLDLVVANSKAWHEYALFLSDPETEQFVKVMDKPTSFRAKYLRGWINRTREYEERYI